MVLKQLIKYWGPVVGWCAVIFMLSSIPTHPSPKIIWWDFVLKKTAHLTEYAILYFLVFRAVNKKLKKMINWLTPFLITIPYAVSDEIHQYFIPGRSCRWYDVMIDISGMLIGLFLIRKILRSQKNT